MKVEEGHCPRLLDKDINQIMLILNERKSRLDIQTKRAIS